MPPISTDAILEFLGCRRSRPTVATLRRLIDAYVQRVPWESAFRIAKRSRCDQTEMCPRWPDEFWRDALDSGGGGTCFESNYAFHALLTDLGFAGYLTINDMGETIGCHTAIVVTIAQQPWLVDVGLPLHRPVALRRDRVTAARGPFHTYYARPAAGNRFAIERSRHPRRNAFTLLDVPVANATYRAAATADYGATGLFLDRVIVVRRLGDAVWRFNSSERPFHLERFARDGSRSELAVADEDAAATVAQHFGMDAATLRAAFQAVGLAAAT